MLGSATLSPGFLSITRWGPAPRMGLVHFFLLVQPQQQKQGASVCLVISIQQSGAGLPLPQLPLGSTWSLGKADSPSHTQDEVRCHGPRRGRGSRMRGPEGHTLWPDSGAVPDRDPETGGQRGGVMGE